ncbi:hypothetical protein J6590_039343 [Homalodisca vitripennis]|nr:hypothetical protein J6590_039343 [Homalodisca vitripennis]
MRRKLILHADSENSAFSAAVYSRRLVQLPLLSIFSRFHMTEGSKIHDSDWHIQEFILYVDRKNLPRAGDCPDYLLPAHHLTLYERKPQHADKKLYDTLPQELKVLKGIKLKALLNDWLTSPF